MLVALATALGVFGVGTSRFQPRAAEAATAAGAAEGEGDAGGDATAELCTDDVQTLTRLTQEAFAELVKVRARLAQLEEETGVGEASSMPADATRLSSSSSHGSSSRLGAAGSAGSASGQQHARHRLAGVVRLGGGLLWSQVQRGSGLAGLLGHCCRCCRFGCSSPHPVHLLIAAVLTLLHAACSLGPPPSLQDETPTADATPALQAAGVKLGTDVLLQLSGLVRDGRDSVQAECKLDGAAEQITLRKVRAARRMRGTAQGGPRGRLFYWHCPALPHLRHARLLLLPLCSRL